MQKSGEISTQLTELDAILSKVFSQLDVDSSLLLIYFSMALNESSEGLPRGGLGASCLQDQFCNLSKFE